MAKGKATTKVNEKVDKKEIDIKNDELKKENAEMKSQLAAMNEMLMQLMAKKEEVKQEKIEPIVEKKQEEKINNFDEFQDIHARYRVQVTSLYHGGLNLSGYNNKEIRFREFLQKKTVFFEDLETIADKNASFLRQGMLFIHDDRVLKLIYLDDDYESVIDPETLKKIFELPVEQIKELYRTTTKTLKKEILYTFAKWINKNDARFLDKNTINAINEVSGEDVMNIAESLKAYDTE